MTSTNDGKDVKSNQTSGHKGKSYYIDLYKSLEKHLSEECELRERTQHLCEAWRRVHSLCQHSASTTHPHYLAWLQRHTANTLLQSEWQSEKAEHTRLEDAINTFIAESRAAATNRNGQSPAWESQLLQRGEWFKSILANPWGHPVLKVLCDPRGKQPTDEEILEWLKEERGVMFVTRLRHLAASRKCHEIALSLASAVMDRSRACETLIPDADQAEDQDTLVPDAKQADDQSSGSTQHVKEPPRPEGKPTFKDILRSEAGFTVDVWELITDLELVLLHKRNEHAHCIALAKKIPLRSGYQLVERLRSRPETSPREKKLWKNAGDLATLVAQVLITRCMVVPCCGGVVRSALYCCARSLVRLLPPARLPAAAGALAAPAATARHLHTLAAAVHTQLHAQNVQDMNSFICELYVRAITAGMNELEKLKIKTEKESEARSMEQTLALWFTALGALLAASARIRCECALTAFSVHPSAAMYDKVKLAPPLPALQGENQEPREETKSEFGSWANDSRGQTNLVKTSETLKLKQTQQHTNVMSTAIFAEGEAIGLSAELCQDLTVCLSGPRVKTLSWDMDRAVLLENCQKYMVRTHGGTRAVTTELKYLNLDPSEYQHLPEEDEDETDVYYGIEKGYEHLVELQEEPNWEDAFLDTETAYSSCMEDDDMPLRRKKKTKRLQVSSDEDSDPLSTIAVVNLGGKKKERPHSKERSKEKKKPKDPEKEKKDNKEKKKRERKTKPKVPVARPGSLASLIGVKIARADEITITDSDYDSQGKSSLASEGNDNNVIIDGVFSMEHKSPDKVDPLSDKVPLNNQLTTANGVAAMPKPKRKPSVNKRKPKANVNGPTDGKPPIQPVRITNSLKSEQKPRPSAIGVVSDQVKRSITKLLQFRRNQNAGLSNKNAPKSDHKPANAIYKPDFPVQPFVSPKSVVVPEIPKSYINKATLEKSDVNRNPSVSSYGKTNEFMGPPPLARFENSSHNSVNEVVRPPSLNSVANTSSAVNYKDVPNVQNYYQNRNLSHQPQTPRSIANDHSRVQPKNISMSLTRVETPRGHVSEHEKSYENFLRELKMSINAGTGVNPSPSPTDPTGVLIKKDYRPTVRGSPLMPSSSTSDLSPQCAKQVPQKKVENAPNTFSRLSYLHKNKQSDIKQKQALETQANRQDEWNKQAAASLDLSRVVAEFKNAKVKYVQTKGETVITRVDNPLNLSCDTAVRKVEKSPPTSRNNPVMSSMLQPTNIPQSPVSRNNTITASKVPSPPGTSYLSEKDQNDLVLLLQQRNRINAVRPVPKAANQSQNTPLNMTTTSNKPASTNVQSKTTQGPSLNNNLQQYDTQKSNIGQFETKPDTVINYAKTATPKQERVKKTTTHKSKPSGRKERTKSTHLEANSLDWESVMNAIRAQKTPSRGPSALELALNKDSTDNSLRNQRIVRTNSVGQIDKVPAAAEVVIKHTNNVKPSTSLDMPLLTPTTEDVVNTQNTSVVNDIQNKSVEIKKAVKNVTPKRVSGGVDKKQTIKNKFAVSISNNKDIDPFIHGRDDDYNLSDLDDLLDDELRRELGELSSDEDAYRIPQAQKGIKVTFTKSNIASKQGAINSKEKTSEVKYVPNATVTSSEQLRPNNMPVLNCQYLASPDTSTTRSQGNSKQKAPVQTSLLKQSMNKVPCNLNKNVLQKEKPVQQVADLSSRNQKTATHSVVNKNVNEEKIANSTVHYKYINSVHSSAIVDNDTVNIGTTVNQIPAPSLHNQYPGTSTSNVDKKVYVVENEPVIQVAVPAANVVLLGPKMYYDSNIQAQLRPTLCSMNQPYVQQAAPNSINQPYVQQAAPNIALFQTATFAAPVVQPASFVAPIVNPLILDNTINVPVTTSQPETMQQTPQETSTQLYYTTPQYQCVDKPQMVKNNCVDKPQLVKNNCVDKPQMVKNNCVDEPQMVKNNEPIVIKECPIPRHTDESLTDTTSNLHNKVTLESNKHSERKASLDVQEKQASKLPRSRVVSTEEVLRDIQNDQQKDQTITNNVLNSLVKNLTNDRREPYSMDTERLKRKRLSILNREIIKKSVHPPIALSYSPIFKSHIDLCEKPEIPIETDKEVVSEEFLSTLGDDENIDIEQKMADVIELITQDVIDTPSLKNDDTDKQTNDTESKENTNRTGECRRILLRSMNKNLPKIPTSANDQNPVGRKTKVRLKPNKVIPETDANDPSEDSNKNDKTQYGVFTLKTISKKNGKRKAVASKCKKPNPALVNDVPPVIEETAESIIDELCKNVTEPLISDSFDIEEALLGAKIPNTIVDSPLCVTLDSPETVLNEESNDTSNLKKPNKITILEDRKITFRRKRKSAKVVISSSDVDINNDNKIEQAEKGPLPNDGGSATVENNCLNKTTVAKTRQSSRKLRGKVLRNSVTIPNSTPEQTFVTGHKLPSELKSLNDDHMKVKADPKTTTEVSKKDQQIQPVEDVLAKSFQNVFEKSAASSNNLQKPSKITNISKTIADLIEQINKGDVLEDNKVAKFESPGTISGGKTAPKPVPQTLVSGTGGLPTQKPVLNISKKVDDNPSLLHEKNSIPQSYKDSIVIEEIPNDKAADNVSKLLRVKLPNGKVYKASVYGKMHTSFDSLFDDPSLRAMLMSNFNEQMKYTLNIKQISTTNKENPDKPVDTRIQEIHVKSSSMKPAVIETINLLSDDEECDDTCSFKTKCGVYKTTLKDKDVIAKHQAKFDQDCSVRLERLIIPEKEVSPNDESPTPDVIEIDEDSDTDNLGETSPPVIANTTSATIEQSQETTAEVIEINDESSNDSIDLLKSCPNLPVALIADVPIKSNISEAKCDTIDTLEVSNEEKIANDDNQTENDKNSQSDDHIDVLSRNESLKGSLDCYVSLSKCDDLVEKYKKIETTECGETTEELDTSFDTSDAEMSSNASLSILNDFTLNCDKNHEELIEDGRSSPVIEIFEVIAALHQKYETATKQMASTKCQSEWMLTKRQICRKYNLIETPLLQYTEIYKEKYSEDGRSSPVIGVFEVIASLRNKFVATETKIENIDTKCHCEWLLTKRQLHQDFNFMEQVNLKNGKKYLPIHQLHDSLSDKHTVSALSIPSLVSIMSIFFRNNSILDHLKPLTKNGNTQRKKSSILNLKRKMQILPDNLIANKLVKNDIMLHEKCTDKALVKCDDGNNMDLLRVSDNVMRQESVMQDESARSIVPDLATNKIKEISVSDEVSYYTADIARENGPQIEDNDSHDNTENMNNISESCVNQQTNDRLDFVEPQYDINEVNVTYSNTIETSYNATFATETPVQSEKNMKTDEDVIEPSHNIRFEEPTGMGNDKSESNIILTLEERHSNDIKDKPVSRCTQNEFASDKSNTEVVQKNSVAVKITSNTTELLSENITEEKEVQRDLNIQNMTESVTQLRSKIILDVNVSREVHKVSESNDFEIKNTDEPQLGTKLTNEIDKAEQNVLEQVKSCQKESSGSRSDVELQIGDILTQDAGEDKQIEASVSLLSQNDELDVNIEMGNVQKKNNLLMSVTSNFGSWLEEKATKVDKQDTDGADMELCQNERIDDMEDVRHGSSISINSTAENGQSQFQNIKITAVLDNLDILEADVMTSQNDQINNTTEENILSIATESKINMPEFDANKTRNEGANKQIVDDDILSVEQQINNTSDLEDSKINIIIGGSNSDIKTSGESYQQDYESILTDQINKRQCIKEVEVVPSHCQHSVQVMDIVSRQNQIVLSNNNSDKTIIKDVLEVSTDDAGKIVERDEENTLIETATTGQLIVEKVTSGPLEDVDRPAENTSILDNSSLNATPSVELLPREKQIEDMTKEDENSGSDVETITIIEVANQDSFTKFDMHVEVLVEKEEQEPEEYVEQIVVEDNIKLGPCDKITDSFAIDLNNDGCIMTSGNTEAQDKDCIELPMGEHVSDNVEDRTCEEQITREEQIIYYNNQDNNDRHMVPDHEYTLRCKVSENNATETVPNEHEEDVNDASVNETIAVQDENDSKDCLLRGIEFQDPEVGTLYVLYPIEDSGSDTATLNDSCDDTPETLEEIEDEVANSSTNVEALQVNVPKITYSKHPEDDLKLKKNLKRKVDFTDSKFTTKKYRKGKNIDYPKITAAAMIEQGYAKEYKRVVDYSSSLKFSYTQPFHKDYLDVDETIKNWPIKGPCLAQADLATASEFNIFADTETTPNYEPIPMEQSLGEEINQDYNKVSEPSSDINESNFKMGFGEGSGRVIQNLEDVGDISKVSAATLSDVKQPQPFLLSEHCEGKDNKENAAKDQLQKIQHYLTFIRLREKVKSFFQKTTIELTCHSMDQKKKETLSRDNLVSTFPFDFYIGDFIKPPPFETIVQVVQVGQLPVSAAAQNPVTCDPRVTQVSNASPSQCSVDNSPQDDSSTPIKTEYTELTTADLSLPLVQEYAQHNQTMSMESHHNPTGENIPIETEIKSVVKIELEELEEKEELPDLPENTDTEMVNHSNEYSYGSNNTAPEMDMPEIKYEIEDPPPTPYGENNVGTPMEQENMQMMFNSTEDIKDPPSGDFPEQKQNGAPEKTDQIAHAMSAAGITTTAETIANNRAQALVNMINQKIRQNSGGGNTQTTANSYSKTTSINALALQQALAQILPPPLNQTNATDSNQQTANTPQVLHIVQGKNASGSQITLVDNSQQSVISGTNATPVLHIVQNKSGTGVTTNGAHGAQNNSFSGLSLVDAGLQQGGNQLLHIVNTGSQKNNNAGQLLKRVNLLTNLTNVQGSNEQKMVQFVCKSADGKSIQLNAPHQRSMVLRLQPIESPTPAAQAKPAENQDPNQSQSAANNKDAASQQEIKSRSVYEENYAKFIQNSGTKPAASGEKSTSLPKFNQAFGKPVFQDGTQKSNEMNSNGMPSVNTPTENNECPSNENAINLEHIGQISSPPLLLRKSPAQTSQAQTNLVQQIKQTIAPMNIQTMHGGVIYTRQIPVNIGGGQTINLITVPSTELVDESGQKQSSNNQGEVEPSIIKIVPQGQSTNNSEMTEDGNANMGATNENNQNPQPQPQPVLTQMRIKLPMLSKAPQMVGGTRVVRPSFFQIQRNVIGGANQPVYQQLVLTAAPPLGQQTIRLPTANRTQIKVPTESQSSTESMSSSTLEQLREFDMVLEQVKERSTVQPNSASTTFPKLHTPTSDASDNAVSAPSTPSEQTQVLYSIGNNQQLNVAYVNRKATVTTPTTSNFVRSPDSSGVADSPTSSTHVRMSHAAASEGTSNEVALPKPAKVGSKSKSRPKSSSHTHNTLAKINPVPAKTSTQKPLEDEQTTQRILYILAEYKEQVENSPDKDKPAPRRRSNPPSNPGSSKRKKSSSGSRRICGRDMSPVHGDETCRTMGSEDSSCGTSQGDCNENCLESHSPQDSPRKIVRKLTYEPENAVQQPRPQPQRNVIVADGQTITVARGTAGKPATAVLMPANYILPVSMVKGGQQIAIVTNRGPKLLTVGGGEGGATNALLLQRLIGPGGLKPVLARPGVRHVRLPTAALHNLQAFNLTTATTVQPPDSTASPAPAPTPPELVETRAASSPWTNRESEDVKPERGSSPEGSEPWNLPSSADPHDYTYEETVRADNMDRTVLDPIPDRYSPDMEAQRIFDKMFDVDNKKSYITDSPRCGYDIDASDCDDKAYHQVVHKKDGTSQRHHRLTHVSAAALRHKYAILEHELRLQKSLSEECEDLGVDSPSASELFPEAELLFAASPAHDHTQDQGQQSHTPQPTILNQSGIPQPDIDDQIATDQLLPREVMERQQLELGLEDVGIVSVGAHGMQTIALDHEEFARAHPNTTFHTDEPTDDSPVPPFAIAGLKGRHITSTIFHSNRAPATVLMTAPQTTVISQASAEPVQNVKYADIDNMINSLPSSHNNINLSSVLVKDDGLTRFDNILNDTRELHLTNTASAIVHSTGNATQVIRRVCYDDKRDRDASFLMDEPDAIIAGDDAKMIAEDSSRDATLESMADVDDDRSSPERHAELFWESNSASERSESRRPLDFSSDSDKCCKSPSYDETNSTDSSGVGTHMRLDSVIKDARGIERSGSADGSSADDAHPPLRTYPPKRLYAALDGAPERSVSGKTRAGERTGERTGEGDARRRASGRGVVKRGCHCCNGEPAPRPKKPRQRKPNMDFAN